ncbi:MAG: hypothetical protein JW959_06775 [Pirellulales bacterium]|nr:hypothetical protein [Pirellulales bacterium]
MASKYLRIGVDIFVVVVIGAILAALLLPEPQCAWNSGSHERLRNSLRAICQCLISENPHDKIDPLDFTPYYSDSESQGEAHDAKRLIEQHGVRVKWHQSGAWSDVLFYPIALSDKIVIDSATSDCPTPQIVMVPVERMDEETLPNLHGCTDLTAEEKRICQLRRMKALFSARGIVGLPPFSVPGVMRVWVG